MRARWFTGRLVDLHYFPHDRFEYGLIAGIIDSVVKGNIHTVVFSIFSADIPTKITLLYNIIIQGVLLLVLGMMWEMI